MLLGKDKLDTLKVLISKALIDPYSSHDEFPSVNNVLKECNEMKKEIKNSQKFSKILSVGKTKQNRLMLLSNRAVFEFEVH